MIIIIIIIIIIVVVVVIIITIFTRLGSCLQPSLLFRYLLTLNCLFAWSLCKY